MAFRQLFSSVDASRNAAAESSLEAVVIIGEQIVGRVQGLRRNGRTNNRPVQEIGTDRVIEFVAGIKNFQGTLQTIAIQYGDLVKRLASFTGTQIDPRSKAAMLTNFPEFEISVFRRGVPNYGSPTLYADTGTAQNLVGTGELVFTQYGCSIDSFESAMNVNDSLIMESVSYSYIDEATKAVRARKAA